MPANTRARSPKAAEPETDAAQEQQPAKPMTVGEALAAEAQEMAAEAALREAQKEVLRRLREPLPPHLISKKPVDTGGARWDSQQRKFITKNGRAIDGENCEHCGGKWMPKGHGHLDYAGHAGVTDRLLSVDLTWNWEPLAYDADGLPVLLMDGASPVGMWIRLTVGGMSRIGYGSVEKGKNEPIKELIGDAIRNAAMRFGVGLELWHKGELHHDDEPQDAPSAPQASQPTPPRATTPPAQDNAGDANSDARPAHSAKQAEARDRVAVAQSYVEKMLQVTTIPALEQLRGEAEDDEVMQLRVTLGPPGSGADMVTLTSAFTRRATAIRNAQAGK